jgi:hypothetical protein
MTSLDQRVRIAADHRSLSSVEGRRKQLAVLADAAWLTLWEWEMYCPGGIADRRAFHANMLAFIRAGLVEADTRGDGGIVVYRATGRGVPC